MLPLSGSQVTPENTNAADIPLKEAGRVSGTSVCELPEVRLHRSVGVDRYAAGQREA